MMTDSRVRDKTDRLHQRCLRADCPMPEALGLMQVGHVTGCCARETCLEVLRLLVMVIWAEAGRVEPGRQLV